MDRWKNRVAVVTGASSGIGATICKLLSENGMKVVGCARRIEKLEEMKKGLQNFYPYKCDMKKEDEIMKMFKWIEEHPNLGKVDVCIPNAGLSHDNKLIDGTMAEWRSMLDVNVLSLQLCTQLAVKSMLKNKINDGQIILTSSIFGHQLESPYPGVYFYCATKHAVKALCEGWRRELRSYAEENNIRIAQLSPGMVKTEIAEVGFGIDKATSDALYDSMPHLKVEDMAQCVKFILESPPRMQIHDILVRPTLQKW